MDACCDIPSSAERHRSNLSLSPAAHAAAASHPSDGLGENAAPLPTRRCCCVNVQILEVP